jgi:hypothetical protein
MMRRLHVVFAFACALLSVACQAPGRPAAGFDDFAPRQAVAGEIADGFVASDAPRSKANGSAEAERWLRDAQAVIADGAPALQPEANEAEAAPAAERMLVYRGAMRVEVARPEDAGRDFLDTVKAWGGYLQSQNAATVTVRVPAAKFEDALAAVRGMGRVLDESRQANDVTEEYLDLGIRLDTARKARERLLEVLQKAEKVEDILKVEAELRRLTEEIERMEGRRKFLADQVALATLSATFQAIAQAPPPPPRPKQRSRFPWIQRVGAESMMGGF